MTLQEVLKTKKRFKKQVEDDWIEYYENREGPYGSLVDCGYFVLEGDFSTSLDLYREDILAEDWEIHI